MCPFFMLSAKHLQRDEKPPPPRVTLVGTSRWSQLKNVGESSEQDEMVLIESAG